MMSRTAGPRAVPSSLQPCPRDRNCVSSLATHSSHRVDPFPCVGTCEETLARLRNLVELTPGASIVVCTNDYLRAEYRSTLLRFVDDLELLVDRHSSLIQVRSASRVGSWDLGANRRRVEDLRRRFARLPP